jgi:hypothetical protein
MAKLTEEQLHDFIQEIRTDISSIKSDIVEIKKDLSHIKKFVPHENGDFTINFKNFPETVKDRN